jgi:hypothetical protein
MPLHQSGSGGQVQYANFSEMRKLPVCIQGHSEKQLSKGHEDLFTTIQAGLADNF